MASGRFIPWPEEKIARLRELWQAGVSAAEIGRQMGGLSKNAILGRAYRLGCVPRGGAVHPCAWTPAQDEALRQMWADLVSMRDIAERLGNRSKSAVHTRATRLKLPARNIRTLKALKAATQRSSPPPRPKFDLNAIYPDPVTNRPCQYIEGEPTADDSCKCGRHARVGSPYCPAHFYLCHAGLTWAPTPGGNTIDNGPLCQRKPVEFRNAAKIERAGIGAEQSAHG